MSGRFRGTRPDYGSYFLLKNVSATFPMQFSLTSTRVVAFEWPSGNGSCTRSKTQAGPRVNGTVPCASNTMRSDAHYLEGTLTIQDVSGLLKNSNRATVAALCERRFFWNQRNTGGHRPPLQLIRPFGNIFQQPVSVDPLEITTIRCSGQNAGMALKAKVIDQHLTTSMTAGLR